MTVSWLDTPAGAVWPDDDDPRSFVRYRRLLSSYHRAMDAGWTDADFVDAVVAIDDAIAGVDGSGFRVTPAGWSDHLAGGGAPATVFAKDETGNVGGSHKARHLMGLLLHLAVDAVATEARLAISSCGNAALGAATVARAAGRPIDVFIPTWADQAVVDVLSRLEATIHVCERRDGEAGDPCMLRFQEAVGEGALPFGVQATENVLTLDGGRTIGWELADQMAPHGVDDVVIQVGGGALLTSCAIGLLEARSFGVLATAPRVWATQAEGCAPFDRAWRGMRSDLGLEQQIADASARADELMTPWIDPTSAATGILDDLTYDWLGIARALIETGGGSIVSAEDEILDANRRVVAAGYDADATGTAGYAGVLAGVRQGLLEQDGSVATLVTGIRR